MEFNTEINHSSIVSEDISKLFLNEALSDVVFIVEGKNIFAHKIVLSARSPVFRQILIEQNVLRDCKREIHVKDCSALSFKNFIKYVYTGKISLKDLDENEKQEMLALALKYSMKELVESIVEPERVAQRISEQNKVVPKAKERIAEKNNPTKALANTQNEKAVIPTPLKFEDIANVFNGAVVVEGLNPQKLFSGEKDISDEKCLTKHKIEANSIGIVIKLNIPVMINVLKFRLSDIDVKREYCYTVYISLYRTIGWQSVSPSYAYTCRSWQSIFFEQTLVQYIKIVGTYSNEKCLFSSIRYFAIMSFYCGLTQRPPKMWCELWEPEHNIASVSKGAIVCINNGNDYSYCRAAKMINDYIEFEYKKYNQICSEFRFDTNSELIVHLSQPIVASNLSFYIAGEDRFKYTVKISVDALEKVAKKWTLVADQRKSFNPSGWQRICFPKSRVLLISIGNIRCLDETVDILPIMSFLCPLN